MGAAKPQQPGADEQPIGAPVPTPMPAPVPAALPAVPVSAEPPASRWRVNGPWWGLVLALAQLPAFLLLMFSNYPGRANVDIKNQAQQALGLIPFADWHPPAMAALWQFLHALTGQMGSLLVLQLVGICLASWMLSRLIGQYTGRRWLTLLGVLLPFTPQVLSQLGVLWKDTQMGVAFLLALLLLLKINHASPRTWWWLVPALVLLGYGTLVRKNALAAVPPLLAIVAWQAVLAWLSRRRPIADKPAHPEHSVHPGTPGTLGTPDTPGTPATGARATTGAKPPSPRRRFALGAVATVLACGVFSGGVAASDALIAKTHHVQETGANLQVMLDDVLFTVPREQLEQEPLPTAYKAHLLKAQALCQEKGVNTDAYWKCYGRGVGGGYFSPLDHQSELKALWARQIPSHPGRYLEYRLITYGYYLTHSVLVWWPTQWRGDAVSVGLGNSPGPADTVSKWWVVNAWENHARVIYLPAFWLALGVLGLVFSRWAGRARVLLLVASASAVLYQLAYFPVIPAPHFRYTWWPALALTAAWLVVLALGLNRWITGLTHPKNPRGTRKNGSLDSGKASNGAR